MSAVAVRTKKPVQRRLADALAALGDIPFERIRSTPLPGPATEAELIRLNETKDEGLFELVDGMLVEKDMSFYESRVSTVLIYHLEGHVTKNKLGIVLTADAMQRFGSQVRLPDVSYIAWSRFPGGKLPRSKILDVGIDIAVEVLSESNTPVEMLRKRREYFASGAKQVWEIDPEDQSARIYTTATKFREVGPGGTLEGGKIIPGFSLPMAKLFDEVGPRALIR